MYFMMGLAWWNIWCLYTNLTKKKRRMAAVHFQKNYCMDCSNLNDGMGS